MNYDRHPTLKVGDRVRCLRSATFLDNTQHNKQDVFVVEDATLAYYQMFTDNRNYEVCR
jgi:hypothetical protein